MIAIEMSLPRNERQEPEHILTQLRQTMERLAETTPSPIPSVLDEFNQKFKDKYTDVARPSEVNGLQKIVIFRNPSNQALPEIVTPKNISIEVDKQKDETTSHP